MSACAALAVCPVCERADASPHIILNQYQHYRCPACGHVFVSPMPTPEELDSFYQNSASLWSAEYSWKVEPVHKRVLWRRILHVLERQIGRGPLLDVGCGSGLFLHYAQSQGWTELHGVELSGNAVELARKKTQAIIHNMQLEQAQFPDQSFSAVTFYDVLEHSPTPQQVLEEVRRILRPGGCLVIECPNVGGVTTRVWGRTLVLAPEHLSIFCMKSLCKLLEDSGFSIVKKRSINVYIREWVTFVSGLIKRQNMENKPTACSGSYGRVYKMLTGGIMLAAIEVVNVFLNAFGIGDELLVIARKK